MKILDFGLARPGAVSQENQLTRPGVLLGTPAFMSPEQACGSVVDGRSDLFSLGCVLYQMCTGEQPFQGESMMAILTRLATHTPEPPAALNPSCRRHCRAW